MRKGLGVLIVLLLVTVPLLGQRVKWKYFNLTEENDFLNITQRGIDRYYTQGLRFEFRYQVSSRKFLEKLVIPVSDKATNIYSVLLSQQIYTPRHTIAYFYKGDHPYGSALYLTEALESYDSTKQMRLMTHIDAGIIGPASLGESTQLLFHKIIGNPRALSWETQMRTDIYLNYYVNVEKAITKPGNRFRVEWKTQFNVGTALVSTVPGINLEYGTWYDQSKKFSWQIFFRPELRMVAFNAMLQGGILNQAYTDQLYSQFFIKDIKSFVYSHATGFRMRYNKFQFMYRQVNLTREFTGQEPHYYGSLIFSFPIGN